VTFCFLRPVRICLFIAVTLAVAVPSPSSAQQVLLIYGGSNHETFLGCLNCSKADQSSVHNTYGSFGSRYSGTSIFNHYSLFGSVYSSEGVCSDYASDPPVIMDQQGHSYGRLTLNAYALGAIKSENVLSWLHNVVCER